MSGGRARTRFVCKITVCRISIPSAASLPPGHVIECRTHSAAILGAVNIRMTIISRAGCGELKNDAQRYPMILYARSPPCTGKQFIRDSNDTPCDIAGRPDTLGWFDTRKLTHRRVIQDTAGLSDTSRAPFRASLLVPLSTVEMPIPRIDLP